MRVAFSVVVRGRPMHSAPFLPSTAPYSRFLLLAGELVAVSVGLGGHGAATSVVPRLATVLADDGTWIR